MPLGVFSSLSSANSLSSSCVTGTSAARSSNAVISASRNAAAFNRICCGSFPASRYAASRCVPSSKVWLALPRCRAEPPSLASSLKNGLSRDWICFMPKQASSRRRCFLFQQRADFFQRRQFLQGTQVQVVEHLLGGGE